MNLRGLLTGEINQDNVIGSVTIETRWLPPIVIDKPLQGGGGPPNPLMQFLAPRVIITTPLRGDIVSTPYGEPGPNKWPQVKLLLAVGGVAAVLLLAGKIL